MCGAIDLIPPREMLPGSGEEKTNANAGELVTFASLLFLTRAL